ncbi:protein FAM69C [Biomphalaria glabrata]|uniref:FAM69 N-terminal domain-containing protein n=1 Tax=Biomphalaria glabrata TaxID=6526 RepID=A0A2C9KSS7_BIOGL|nr:protein FAM69C-like [Biomphalaria glabrata]KAI8790797.1 protein FAM69C [Biomphalaria glabrata]
MFQMTQLMRNVPTITSKKKVFVLGVVFFVFIYLLIHVKSFQKIANNFIIRPCDNEHSRNIITQICSLYKSGEINGTLCEPLCNTYQVTFTKCLNYRSGKFVIQAECNDMCVPRVTVSAVLKMSRIKEASVKDYIESIGLELLRLVNSNIQTILGQMNLHNYSVSSESLSVITADLLKSEYGFLSRDNQNVLNNLWGNDYYTRFTGTVTSFIYARSYWSVVKQNEFRVSQFFNNWDVFPKIYAFCGPLYITENIPSLKSIDKLIPILSSEFPSWNKRATLAKQILNFVKRTDEMEHPIHFCDIKSPHFGFTYDDNVRFIDADLVIADEALSSSLGSLKCVKHEDCAIYDCQGWCDLKAGYCTKIRTNNNLQSVCAKIFRSEIISAYGGLLSSPPKHIAEKLTALVNKCADEVTTNDQGVSMQRPDIQVLTTLQKYLNESLS